MANRVQAAQNEANTTQHTVTATVIGLLAAAGFALGDVNAQFYALAIGACVGFVVLVWRIKEHDNRAYGIQVEPEVVTVETVVYQSLDDKYVTVGKMAIYQPSAGKFAALLRYSIDNTRREFALRSALRMGWTEPEYLAMVYQLVAVGWFGGDVHNGAYVPSDDAIPEIREWLAMDRPTPPTD